MDSPKQKPKMSNPKTLNKSIRTLGGVKSGVSKSVKTAHEVKRTHLKLTEQIPGQEKSHRPEEYMTDKAAEKTGYAARKAGGKITGKANEAIRSRIKKEAGKQAKKGVNASKQTTKATKKTIKTTKKGVKTAAKTAKKSAKAARKAAVAAKKTAVLAAKVVKATVKAVIAAVKAAVAAVKGLITIIAAGGWIVIVIILIIAVIMLVISSPFGAFANESDGEMPTLSEVVQEINGEYTSAINKIIIDAGEIDEVVIEGETASSGYSPSNWIDVLAVFSVKSTINDNPDEYMDVAIMDTEKIKALKDIFWQMNSIAYEIEEEPVPIPEPTPNPTQAQNPTQTAEISPTPEPTPEVIRTLIITMASKTYIQGSEIYDFTDEQYKVLEEMMSPQYIAMYMELCGMDTFNGLTPEQLSRLINELPEGELGSVIVEYALTRLGHPYSRQLRGQGNYVDCSYFARWCYQQAGVSHFTAGTAAEQARYCVNNNLCISNSDLQIGDLIFWSFHTNGRFMDITHVGIYAGNGYVIDASSYRGMVVYRPIFGESSIVVCGRPHVLD